MNDSKKKNITKTVVPSAVLTDDDAVLAAKILGRDRSTPKDIAWAWAALNTIQTGESLERDERFGRDVASNHRFILDLELPGTKKSGKVPAEPGAHETGLLVRVADVRRAAIADTTLWPILSKAEPKPAKERTYTLDAAITQARAKIGADADHHGVWEALKDMALTAAAPFSGGLGAKGELEYKNAEDVTAYFSKSALQKRLLRESKKRV